MDDTLKLASIVATLIGMLGVIVRWLMSEVSTSRKEFLAELRLERTEGAKDREADREVRQKSALAIQHLAVAFERLGVVTGLTADEIGKIRKQFGGTRSEG